MEKKDYRRMVGSRSFRQRLVLATLSGTAISVEDIRSDDESPGLRPHEVSLLRLIERISDHCKIQINETGTKLRYKPGVIINGRNIVHDCALTRSIGYFLEPLVLLALFGKRPLEIRLKGITNDSNDPSVDTFGRTVGHILKKFGVLDEIKLKIDARGSPPLGGGEISLQVPIVANELTAVNWIDEGMVKSIRGVSFCTKVSPQLQQRMIYSARGLFNNFIPDVYIDTDQRSGPSGGRSPGYGMSLVAETTTGCILSVDYAVSYPISDDMDVDSDNRPELMSSEDAGTLAASMLLEEIAQGGVVDSTHQGFLFLLCALCPPDVSKVRVGKLTPYGIETLRNIKDFLNVKFSIKPDPNSTTITLKCIGFGMKNLSRKIA